MSRLPEDGRSGATNRRRPTTAEIRLQIEQTRAEMSRTIDAIHERLSPTRLVSDAKQRARDAAIHQAKNVAQKAVLLAMPGNSPVRFALAGVSAAAAIVRAVRRARNGKGRVIHAAAEPTGVPPVNGAVRYRTPFLAAACAGIAYLVLYRKSRRDPAARLAIANTLEPRSATPLPRDRF
jgi:hypothetical protein